MQPQAIKKFPDTNIIYLYDLPNKTFTSTALAKVIKDKTGYNLEHMPQVRRDPGKPFYTAVIKIDNPDKFLEVSQKLRYFQLEDKPCRALPYQTDLLGSNVTRLQEQNLFVRRIPKTIHSEGLETLFKGYGEIISCKVSINEDYSSRGYGFVCFRDPESAARALQESSSRSETIGVKFAPKSKADFRKVFNNIFVKNIPDEWQEPDLKKAFEVFGRISSIFTTKHNNGLFAFICYGSEDSADREYGPRCAAKAVAEMDNKEIFGKVLYVKPALKKSEREKELQHETLKYKNSKKRCNLYVKNFLPETTEEDLRNLFQQYGEIESLKLFGQKDNKSPFAFVCFKTPDTASQVKNAQLHINNRPLYINHYEMKQQRDLLNESNKDKQDWQRYQAENFATFDYQSLDQISNLLRLLMHNVQQKNNSVPHMGGAPGGPQQRSHSTGQHHNIGYQQQQNNFRGGHNNYQNNGAPRQGYQNNRGNQNQHIGGMRDNQASASMPPALARQPMPMAGAPMPLPGGMPMPAPGMIPPQGGHMQLQIQFAPSNDPMANEFYNKTMPIYAAITEINPTYKQTVGTCIFEFVTKLVGQQYAPKITGMLIDLPIPEIQRYVTNFNLFAERVHQAQQLLQQQAVAQPQL